MRTKQIGNKIYTERTKDFYIENGRETEPHFIKSIKIRESQGDKL